MERTLGQGIFANLINDPADTRVSKSIKEFMPGTAGFEAVDPDAVAALLDSMAGRGTESEEMFPTPGAAKFPTQTVPNAGDGRGGNPPQTPYGTAEAMYPVTRLGNNYVVAPVDPGIAAPADFNAPVPGRNPADGPAPVMKAKDELKPGTFAGTMQDQFGQPLTPRRK